MAKKLDRYRDKRDPSRTNEPFGAEPLRSPEGTRAGRFVVHLHDASRQHYDLRLEVGGALESFAVPKGPTQDPAHKHLAVHTEQHPLDYLDFEAVIPDGNYGAGPMIVWDRGTVRYLETSAEQGLEEGKLDFVLHGYKLRGRFALVRLGGKKKRGAGREWLLLKKADAHAAPSRSITEDEPRSVLSGLRVDELARAGEIARALQDEARALGARSPAPRGSELVPMRCAERGGKLDDPSSLYELKLDGVRIVAERDGEHVALRYRTRRNATVSYPEVTRALRALPTPHVVLDGEIIAFDDAGRPSFERLARRIHASPADVAHVALRVPVTYVVFDLLGLGDLDLRRVPLHARKRLLERLLPPKGVIRPLDYVRGDGSRLLAFCEERGLEGIVQKRADSHYVSGTTRSTQWRKIKRVQHGDFVVTALVRGKGARKRLGALEIASYVGERLVTRGRVGSGLDDDAIARLCARLLPLARDSSAAEGELMPAPEGRVFVEPEVVISVQYTGFTPEGRLRHPVYRGERPDVSPRECTASAPAEREALLEAQTSTPPVLARRARVTLSRPDKVFWPDEGITKGELCGYYESIADVILPYLRDRPVLMVRYPDGITGKHFFQWNAPPGAPSWVRTHVLHSEEHGRDVTFVAIDDLDTLLYVVNLGCIPLHILASRFSSLEACDFLTIDFDLGSSPLSAAIVLARSLHELLGDVGLAGFAKTSGQTGLHVLVPLGGASFEVAKTLAALLGRLLHTMHPQLCTLERRRKARPEAVYVDTGQTGRSRAIVAPYSVRAHKGATVSTPLAWDEVHQGLHPARFDIFSVPARIAEHGDPMAALLETQVDLAAAIERLGERIARGP